MKLRVKELLARQGRTAKEMALAIGSTESGVSIALSPGGNPTLKSLERMAGFLGVPVRELFAPDGDGFVALVCDGGQTYRADSLDALQALVDELRRKKAMQ